MPLERLVRLLAVLWQAGDQGLSTERLVAVGAYGGDDETGQRRQLTRDLAELNRLGYDIRNVAPEGTDAVYRLVARDNRLRVSLTLPQQVQLVRAAQIARLDERAGRSLGVTDVPSASDLRVAAGSTPTHLDAVLRAVTRQCLVRFAYNGKPRAVHPQVVFPGASGWYVEGHEDGDTVAKVFVVARMSDVRIDAPGTADQPTSPRRRQLDPMTWQVDPPTDVHVETTPEHRPHVEATLGTPTSVEDDDGRVVLTLTVTHRAAFRARLYELGRRVRVLGPADVRAEILAELTDIAGNGR